MSGVLEGGYAGFSGLRGSVGGVTQYRGRNDSSCTYRVPSRIYYRGLSTYQCYFGDSLLQLSYSIQQNPILTRLVHYRALEGFIGARVPFLVLVCEASVAGVRARACKVYRPSRGWGFRLQWSLGFKIGFAAATWYFVLQSQHWSTALCKR